MQKLLVQRAVLSAFGAIAVLLAGGAKAEGVPGQGTWEATLQGRTIAGNAVDASSPSAVFLYDTELDITWLRDANVNGQQDWYSANTWAGGLLVGAYSGWRLPTTTDTGPPGCDFSYEGGTDCGYNVDTASSEMAHLWYDTLGNKAYCTPGGPGCIAPQPGWGLTNTGTFQNMQPFSYYWSEKEFAPGSPSAWIFNVSFGYLDYNNKTDSSVYAIAVRPGDVLAVPEPQTYVLALTGLGMLGFVARRRRGTEVR